ncbi:hypothetical protein IGJ55_002756 [Enterococcus sp. AZ170]
MTYEVILDKFKNVVNLMMKRENARRNFVYFNRVARIVFIVSVSIYSVYLYMSDPSFSFNYGLAWWIIIFLLVVGWIGEFFFVSFTTKTYHEYLKIRDIFSETVYQEYKVSRLHKVAPFLDEEESFRNPEYLYFFECGFGEYAKEIQETYLESVSIYLFDVTNIHELSDFLDTDEIPKYIGEKVAKDFNTSFVDCLLINSEENPAKYYIVIYTK